MVETKEMPGRTQWSGSTSYDQLFRSIHLKTPLNFRPKQQFLRQSLIKLMAQSLSPP